MHDLCVCVCVARPALDLYLNDVTPLMKRLGHPEDSFKPVTQNTTPVSAGSTTSCTSQKSPDRRRTLTSGRQLFGVDYFGGVLLSRAQLDASAHHRKGSPAKTHREGKQTFGQLGVLVGTRASLIASHAVVSPQDFLISSSFFCTAGIFFFFSLPGPMSIARVKCS